MLNQHSLHLGIVNFWPLFHGLVDDDDVIENLLDLLMDSDTMLSPYGVRSLSARDQFYLSDKDASYRGNLFVHLHYMLLRGLKIYYTEGSPSMVNRPHLAIKTDKVYALVKERIVSTVYN